MFQLSYYSIFYFNDTWENTGHSQSYCLTADNNTKVYIFYYFLPKMLNASMKCKHEFSSDLTQWVYFFNFQVIFWKRIHSWTQSLSKLIFMTHPNYRLIHYNQVFMMNQTKVFPLIYNCYRCEHLENHFTSNLLLI